jgi:hypothetical protein
MSAAFPMEAEDWKRISASLSHRVHGVFPSRKTNAPVPWRTPQERDLIHLLEVDPEIEAYEALPERVAVIVNGRKRTLYPGFRVHCRDSRVAILDAVSDREANSAARCALTKHLTGFYAERGVAYRVIPEKVIRLEPRYSNAGYVLSHIGHSPTSGAEQRVMGVLSTKGPWTLRRLDEVLPGVDEPKATACAMALSGLLALDLSAQSPDDIGVSFHNRRMEP